MSKQQISRLRETSMVVPYSRVCCQE